MRYVRRSPLLRRVVLPITLLAFLSACHKWVPLELPVAQAVTEEEPGTVRITLADNSRVVPREPRVSGDSLVALEDTVGVALDDVRQIEARRTKVLATVGLISGAVVVAVFGYAVAACALGACAGT